MRWATAASYAFTSNSCLLVTFMLASVNKPFPKHGLSKAQDLIHSDHDVMSRGSILEHELPTDHAPYTSATQFNERVTE